MNFKRKNAPHISQRESTRVIMGNVTVVLLALYGLAFYHYGPRALVLGVVGVASSILADWMCLFVLGKKIKMHDLSAIITGLMLPLIMPASVPYQVIVVACIFGIVVAKHPFGGVGHNIFNPAATGYAFAVTSYSSTILFRYPLPGTLLPLWNLEGIQLVESPAFAMKIGGIPSTDLMGMALGKAPGPMGTTSALVLVACLLFLISRKTIGWQTPVFFLGTTSILALFFQRIPVPGLESVFYENMTGILLFGGIFMLGDPVTTPTRSLAKIIHAVLCGVIVMTFRHVGKIEEGFVFALLLMNAAVWACDIFAEKIAKMQRGKRFETSRHTSTSKKTKTAS